jgi:hypothetical protein
MGEKYKEMNSTVERFINAYSIESNDKFIDEVNNIMSDFEIPPYDFFKSMKSIAKANHKLAMNLSQILDPNSVMDFNEVKMCLDQSNKIILSVARYQSLCLIDKSKD